MVDRDIEDRLRDSNVDPGRALNVEAAEEIHHLRQEMARLSEQFEQVTELFNLANHLLAEKGVEAPRLPQSSGWKDQW